MTEIHAAMIGLVFLLAMGVVVVVFGISWLLNGLLP
jgi:hypothetical protein